MPGLTRRAAPVHLVGVSSGGWIVTHVALAQPDLVRSLTVLEPPIDELVADLPAVQSVRNEWIKAFEPIRAAALPGEATPDGPRSIGWVPKKLASTAGL